MRKIIRKDSNKINYAYFFNRNIFKENNYDIELVEVSTFKEAIDYLTK